MWLIFRHSVVNLNTSPLNDIVETHTQLSVEIPVGNVKDLLKKFEPADVSESVDTLQICSSEDDLLPDIGKLTAWFEGDSPFPPSAPRDRVRRSKARRKASKKKYDAEDKCHCRNPACATPEFGGPSTAQSIPSSTSAPSSTSTSSSISTT